MIKIMNNHYMLAYLIDMIFPTIYSYQNEHISIYRESHRYICPLKHNMILHPSAKLNSCGLDYITDRSCTLLLLLNSYPYSSSRCQVGVIEMPNNNSKIERISFITTGNIHTLINELIYKQFNVTLKLNTAMNIRIIYDKINYITYSSYLI